MRKLQLVVTSANGKSQLAIQRLLSRALRTYPKKSRSKLPTTACQSQSSIQSYLLRGALLHSILRPPRHTCTLCQALMTVRIGTLSCKSSWAVMSVSLTLLKLMADSSCISSKLAQIQLLFSQMVRREWSILDTRIGLRCLIGVRLVKSIGNSTLKMEQLMFQATTVITTLPNLET